MSARFSLRRTCIMAATVMSVSLVALAWVSSGRESVVRSMDCVLVDSCKESPGTGVRVDTPEKPLAYFELEDTAAASGPSSCGFGTTSEFSGSLCGDSPRPLQGAGAYWAYRKFDGNPASSGGIAERHSATQLLTSSANVSTSNGVAQKITEHESIRPLGEFSLNILHQQSPTSQGLVVVNF